MTASLLNSPQDRLFRNGEARSTAEELRAWWRSVNREQAAYRIDDADGGYLVPTVLLDQYNEALAQSISGQVCKVIPVTNAKTVYPIIDDHGTPGYAEPGTPVTPTDITWKAKELYARKRVVFSRCSTELVDDSLFNYLAVAFKQFGEQMALLRDHELIWGDGTSLFGGAVGLLPAMPSTSIIIGTAPGESKIAAVDLLMLRGYLPRPYFDAATVLIHPKVATMVHSELAGFGYTIAGDMTMQSHFTEELPTDAQDKKVPVLVGDFPNAVVIADMQPRAQVDRDRYFDEDLVSLRLTHRYDLQVFNAGEEGEIGPYVGVTTGGPSARIEGEGYLYANPG